MNTKETGMQNVNQVLAAIEATEVERDHVNNTYYGQLDAGVDTEIVAVSGANKAGLIDADAYAFARAYRMNRRFLVAMAPVVDPFAEFEAR